MFLFSFLTALLIYNPHIIQCSNVQFSGVGILSELPNHQQNLTLEQFFPPKETPYLLAVNPPPCPQPYTIAIFL